MRHLAILVTTVTALLGTVGAALAEEDRDAVIQAGVALRRELRDEEALARFSRAYEVSRWSRALAQMVLAEQAHGRWPDAEIHLGAALTDRVDPGATAPPIANATRIVRSSRNTTCAPITDGRVLCWGAGTDGQLGNDSTLDSEVPVPMATAGNDAVVDVGTGYGTHGCGRAAGASPVCWGSGSSGPLGELGQVPRQPVPRWVYELDGVSSIAAGASASCAIAELDGSVYCWGSNAMGALGRGQTAPDQDPYWARVAY